MGSEWCSGEGGSYFPHYFPAKKRNTYGENNFPNFAPPHGVSVHVEQLSQVNNSYSAQFSWQQKRKKMGRQEPFVPLMPF